MEHEQPVMSSGASLGEWGITVSGASLNVPPCSRSLLRRPTEERVKDWQEVHAKISPDTRKELLHTQVRSLVLEVMVDG